MKVQKVEKKAASTKAKKISKKDLKRQKGGCLLDANPDYNYETCNGPSGGCSG